MKTIPTVEGKFYCVATSTSCEVTTEAGTLLGTAEAGQPLWFQAQKGNTTTLSDDNAEYSASRFNSAPQQQLAILGVLGGNDGLPRGYTRVAYVGGTTGSYFSIPEGFDYSDELRSGIELEFVMLKVTPSSSYIWLIGQMPKGSGEPYIGSAYATTVSAGLFSAGNPQGLEKVAGKSYAARWNFCDDGLCSIYSGTEGNFADLRAGMNFYVKGVTPYAAQNLLAKTGEAYRPVQSSYYAAKRVRFSQNTQVTRDLIPALDPTGSPCMYDTVTRTPFYNSGTGAFIAGVATQKQLDAMLRKLPDRTGQDVGVLQVRLAEALQTQANEAKLDAMLSKNWEISQAA